MDIVQKEQVVINEQISKLLEMPEVLEFESRIGLEYTRQHKYKQEKISRNDFMRCLSFYFKQCLSGNFEQVYKSSYIDSLDVWMWNIKQISIRHTINSLPNIMAYCKDNSLFDHCNEIIYKSNHSWDSKTASKLKRKKGYVLDNRNAILDSEYGFRTSLKEEVKLEKIKGIGKLLAISHKAYISDYINQKITNQLDEYNKYDIDQMPKSFRYKRRYSFINIENPSIRIDLSIVKSSPQINGKIKTATSFLNSKILEQNETYEIETEFIGDSSTENIKQNMLSSIFQLIAILQKCNPMKGNLPISLREKKDTLFSYRSLVQKILLEFLETKIKQSKIKGDYTVELEKNLENVKKLAIGFIGPKPYTLELNHLNKKSRNSILSGYSVTDKADGDRTLCYINDKGKCYLIQQDLSVRKLPVTCKDYKNTLLDGEFVDNGKGDTPLDIYFAFDVYIVNGKSVYQNPLSLPTKHKDFQKTRYQQLENIILSCDAPEWIRCKKFLFSHDSSNSINDLSKQIYECGHDKLYHIDGLIFTPNYLPVGLEEDNKIEPSLKNLTYKSIMGKWSKVLKWKPPEENSIDFFVKIKSNISGELTLNLYVGISEYSKHNKDNKELMRKYPCKKDRSNRFPPKAYFGTQKTIFKPDLYYYKNVHIAKIPVRKNGSIETTRGKYIQIMDNSVYEFTYDISETIRERRWKIIRLRPVKTDDYKKEYQMQKKAWDTYKNFNEDFNMTNKDMILKLSSLGGDTQLNQIQKDMLYYLYDNRFTKQLLHRFNITVKDEKNVGRMRKNLENNFVIMDGLNIKERIIKQSDIPIRFNYGNYYITANNVWNTIHNPITYDILCGKSKMPTEEEVESKYYKVVLPRKSISTIQLQHFHNRYVKKSLIEKVSNSFRKGSSIQVLDVCCGKGGDIPKWRDTLYGRKNSILIGIDKYSDNINNTQNGACIRYARYLEDYKKRHKSIVPMDFLVGDLSHNILDGSAFQIEKRSLKKYEFLWKGVKEFDTQKEQSPLFSQRTNNFQIISCQFALHYFWSSIEVFNDFALNISSNLRDKGYFIGTCFDGHTVFEALSEIEQGSTITGEEDGNILWKIRKDYDDEVYMDTEKAFGLPITIFMPSITGTSGGVSSGIKEWLVNFRVMIDMLEKAPHYMFLIDTKDTIRRNKRISLPNKTNSVSNIINKSGTGMFIDMYKEMLKPSNTTYGTFPMSETEQTLSFYNRYFVFQKRVPRVSKKKRV